MPAELAIAQFVAYVALTASSLTIAIVSLTFTYRQNFGWEPLVLVTSHGLQGVGPKPDVYFATIAFEFWNRRKYPLILRSVDVQFSTIEIKEQPPENTISRDWHIFAGKHMIIRSCETLEPTAHKQLSVAAPFARRTLDDLEDSVTIRAIYYDPRRNKQRSLVQHHLWRMNTL